MKHRHYDMIVTTMAELGEWERKIKFEDGKWSDYRPLAHDDWWAEFFDYEIRRIVKPLYQARTEIPRPETEAPEDGATYWVAYLVVEGSRADVWEGAKYQQRQLALGLVYLRKEDAEARVAAMLRTEE